MVEQTKILLSEKEIPTQWYNVMPDMPSPPLPPLNPGTGQPLARHNGEHRRPDCNRNRDPQSRSGRSIGGHPGFLSVTSVKRDTVPPLMTFSWRVRLKRCSLWRTVMVERALTRFIRTSPVADSK